MAVNILGQIGQGSVVVIAAGVINGALPMLFVVNPVASPLMTGYSVLK
jgi:hypothetical protein